MNPWMLIESCQIPNKGGEMRLYRRAEEFSIMLVGGGELMNSRLHGSEDALAALGCAHLVDRNTANILVGGLGMGYTLAAALREVGPGARVVVAELVPEVVHWNQQHIGHFANHPLDDPRTLVSIGDVLKVMDKEHGAFDAILLDVDNGPEGLTHSDNNRLYSLQGLQIAYQALRPGGTLAVWSAGRDQGFSERLRATGFQYEEKRVRAHSHGKGASHTIWVAQRDR